MRWPDWIFHFLDDSLVEVSFFIAQKFGMFNLHKFKILSERSILFGTTFVDNKICSKFFVFCFLFYFWA